MDRSGEIEVLLPKAENRHRPGVANIRHRTLAPRTDDSVEGGRHPRAVHDRIPPAAVGLFAMAERVAEILPSHTDVRYRPHWPLAGSETPRDTVRCAFSHPTQIPAPEAR